MWKKQRVILTIASSLLVTCTFQLLHVPAIATMSCDGGWISEGDSAEDVREKCGEPDSDVLNVDSWTRYGIGSKIKPTRVRRLQRQGKEWRQDRRLNYDGKFIIIREGKVLDIKQ